MRTYKHPYDRRKRPNETTRPPIPAWLCATVDDHVAQGKSAHCYRYWRRLYFATPPWLTDDHIAQMKRIHETCPPGHHVDHIVPLTSAIVSGLNVPWNLRHDPIDSNVRKGNRWWPDMPMAQSDLFDPWARDVWELQAG